MKSRTLPDLIAMLRSAVMKNMNNTYIDHIANEISRKIIVKHNRLSSRYNIYNAQQWASTIRNSPNQISTFFQNPDFNILQKRDVDIVFYYLPSTPRIYSPKHNSVISVVGDQRRILFNNPYNVGNVHIESWSRPKSISYSYNRHLPTSTIPRKSRYLPGVDIITLEYNLFERAYGILTKPSQIFLYGICNRYIGKLPPQYTQLTNLVKMHCDKVRRHVGAGFRLEFHSYPIDIKDLQTDLGSNHQFMPLIKNLVFSI